MSRTTKHLRKKIYNLAFVMNCLLLVLFSNVFVETPFKHLNMYFELVSGVQSSVCYFLCTNPPTSYNIISHPALHIPFGIDLFPLAFFLYFRDSIRRETPGKVNISSKLSLLPPRIRPAPRDASLRGRPLPRFPQRNRAQTICRSNMFSERRSTNLNIVRRGFANRDNSSHVITEPIQFTHLTRCW